MRPLNNPPLEVQTFRDIYLVTPEKNIITQTLTISKLSWKFPTKFHLYLIQVS